MFSGIISDIGTITHAENLASARRFTIACDYPGESLPLGASVACSGICLTISDIKEADGKRCFSVDVSQETLSLTTAAFWQKADNINLELSLKLGDELGGHLVFGHVDGLLEICAIEEIADMWRIGFTADKSLLQLIAKKGSIAIDGISLTVNEVSDKEFSVMIVPYTLQNTILQSRKIGDKCNVEIDMLMRYVARLKESEAS